MLTACDNDSPNTARLTADQQLRLAEIKSKERIEMARIHSANNTPLQQQTVEYNEDPSHSEYYSTGAGSGNSNNESSSSVGSHVLAASAGAVGGYLASKAMSSPANQQRAQDAKRKAYVQYRFVKSKASSKYRSYKASKKK